MTHWWVGTQFGNTVPLHSISPTNKGKVARTNRFGKHGLQWTAQVLRKASKQKLNVIEPSG